MMKTEEEIIKEYKSTKKLLRMFPDAKEANALKAIIMVYEYILEIKGEDNEN